MTLDKIVKNDLDSLKKTKSIQQIGSFNSRKSTKTQIKTKQNNGLGGVKA